ncbi:hypothetical protein GCM10027055_28440 [Janibacter alkaliphilus]
MGSRAHDLLPGSHGNDIGVIRTRPHDPHPVDNSVGGRHADHPPRDAAPARSRPPSLPRPADNPARDAVDPVAPAGDACARRSATHNHPPLVHNALHASPTGISPEKPGRIRVVHRTHSPDDHDES